MRSLCVAIWLVAGSLCQGCLVDLDKPCGDGFVAGGEGVCLCPAGAVAQDGQCAPCGKNEVVKAGQCVCKSGYGRSASDRDCQKEADPLAVEEEASVNDASSCDAGCAMDAGPNDADSSLMCSESSECDDGELCDVYASGGCVAAPDGYQTECGSDADCAGTGATYCDLFSSGTCQIEGCAETQGNCPGDMVCCDYAIIGRSLCIPADNIEEGLCPAPGEKVEREVTL